MRRTWHRGWVSVLAVALAGMVCGQTAHAKKAAPKKAPAAASKSLVGTITGPPMGTWMTVHTGGTGIGSTSQVDLAHAKISEKGKSLKRYDLAQGMKVRVKGSIRGTALSADAVEILERAPKNQAKARGK